VRNSASVFRVLKGLKVQTAYLILNIDVDLNRSVSVSAFSRQKHEGRGSRIRWTKRFPAC